jgi:hypothetical protein
MSTRMSRTRRYATVTALAAALLGACANNDADRGDVVDALTEAGVPESQARCAGRGFEDEFNQDELNEIAEADQPDQIDQDLRERSNAILQECLTGDPGDTGGSGDETESTEDTEPAG